MRTLYYLFKNILIKIFRRKIKVTLSTCIAPNSVIKSYTKLGSKTYFKGIMDSYSYIGQNCRISAEVGRFCSIGNSVKSVSGTHPVHLVSTSPALYSLSRQCGITFTTQQNFNEYKFYDNSRQIDVKIGNDVWIGENVLLLGGISIGDGAVIAAGSLVSKDVEPYSIQGGIPAKEISKRFSNDIISKLQIIKWWNWNERQLKDRNVYFLNVEKFIERFSERDE